VTFYRFFSDPVRSSFCFRAHKFSVTSVAWYPIDTGLFVTAGLDGCVRVWDTNAAEVCLPSVLADMDSSNLIATQTVYMFPPTADEKLYAAALPARGVTHSLVAGMQSCSVSAYLTLAVGGDDAHVRLCDLNSGGSTHTLKRQA